MSHADQPLDERLRAHSHSAVRREARERTAATEAPRAEELEALADGRLADPARRRALAEQLVAGAHWRDALERLGPEPRRTPAPRRVWLPVLAAAAVALLVWILLPPAGLPGDALGQVRLTDPTGLELRGTGPAPRGRLLVELGAAGQLALVHERGAGDLVQVPAAAEGPWTPAQAGEEVLLPLHASVPVAFGERWVVLLARRPLPEAETLEAARRALAGEAPDGPAVVVLVVRG